MIQLKNAQQIQAIADSGKILNSALKAVKSKVVPGVTTGELDKFIHKFITDADAIPAFLNYMGYPGSACISINEEVIHGIPGKRIVKEGDLVSIDVGVNYKGFISDSAFTFTVGKISSEEQRLIDVTQKALQAGIDAAVVGNRIRDISKAVSDAGSEFGIVYDYCGHGVGFEVHEDPQIANVVTNRGKNPRLKAGMVIAIEPMINLGTADVETLADEWTVVTLDRLKSAHFEHTIAITETGPIILT